jgi:hypothetical protein
MADPPERKLEMPALRDARAEADGGAQGRAFRRSADYIVRSNPGVQTAARP